MAAQVLSGSGNVSYTNNTGENVRIIINFLRIGNTYASMSFGGGVTISMTEGTSYGKNLAFISSSSSDSLIGASNDGGNTQGSKAGIPMEIALANGDTFSVSGGGGGNLYNILVIPESG